VEDGKFEEDEHSDSVIFYETGVLKIYYLENGKATDSLIGSYRINQKKKRLVTKYNKQRFELRIVEMTENELVTQPIGSKLLTRYHRLD
jgi:hypothetical protein